MADVMTICYQGQCLPAQDVFETSVPYILGFEAKFIMWLILAYISSQIIILILGYNKNKNI